MKRKLTIIFFAIAMLLAVSATPVFAGDDDKDGSNPPCEQCDGGQVWSG